MILTAGGMFDATAAPIYFGAGNFCARTVPHHALVAVNDLDGASAEKILAERLDNGYTILLDSGIFNLTNDHKRATGCSMDQALGLAPEDIPGFDALFDRYVELVQKYGDQLWGYIELDQGGRANKIRTRTRLENLGFRPIPVYHPLNDGWDYFDELAQNYDRICFGNIVQASSATRVRLLHTLWERRRAYPHLWVHVLGLTAGPSCLPCPPDSCDSSTWLNGVRYPRLDTECAMLRPLIMLERSRPFLYVPGEDTTRDANAASALYADSMAQTNRIWRDLTARTAELGGTRYPDRHEQEGPLCPR